MKLADLVDPGHTAVLVSEMQRGIVGDQAKPEMGQLVQAVKDSGVITGLVDLTAGARKAGAPVIHCTLQFRPNRVGVRIVSPLMAVTMKDPEYLLEGSAAAEIIPELGPAATDVVAARLHGMSAFSGTDLDAILRSLDITTVVIGGVSLNEAIIGASIEAVNLGYRVVIPRDAALGSPPDFAEAMLKHAFSLVAKVTTVEEILAVWGASGS